MIIYNIDFIILMKSIIKMASVLVIGDPHFKVGNVPETEDMTNKLVKLAQDRKPTFIVCLGDILHRHETIHVSPLMRAEEMIRRLSLIAPTYLIIGNHDRPNNSNYLTNEHPFNSMKLWKNTYVVDNVLDTCISGLRFLFVPYVPPGKFEDALKTIDTPYKDATAIFAHQEFYNAKMGAITSQAGDKWPVTNPLVISGHVHDYDKLQSNLIYVGTPMQHAFNDKNDKTVSIFNFDQNSQINEWTEERCDLGLIKRIIVYITPDEVRKYKPPLNKMVKLVIKGNDAEIKSVAKLKKINELKNKGVKISYKTVIEKSKKSEITVKMKYKDRLYDEIKHDENQVKWFNEII